MDDRVHPWTESTISRRLFEACAATGRESNHVRGAPLHDLGRMAMLAAATGAVAIPSSDEWQIMAYDETLAQRIRDILKRRKGVSERKMFGGLAFLVNGHMSCGVNGSDLMLRLGNEDAAVALQEKHTREMDFTGKPLKSMVYVDKPGFRSEASLRRWVDRAVTFARSLPPK